MTRSRKEHIEWCKQRALEYLDQGDAQQAVTSILSDLSKHPGTKSSLTFAQQTVFIKGLALVDASPDAVRRFVEGFN